MFNKCFFGSTQTTLPQSHQPFFLPLLARREETFFLFLLAEERDQ